MQAPQAILTFSEPERPMGDRLLKIAVETDRVEGYSEPHAIAIARMAEKVGARMGLHGIDLTALKFAALAHDLGERSMKRNYLLRPGLLTREETLDLWRHPILGEQAAGELGLSRQTQLLVRWHHEWWNGLGYPDRLAGEAIPAGARILRAVDSYFALASNRPHRQRFDRREAEQAIADLAGIEFDPQIVKLLLQTLAEERVGEEAEMRIAHFETEVAVMLAGSESQTVLAEVADQPIETTAGDEPAPAQAEFQPEAPAPALNAAPDIPVAAQPIAQSDAIGSPGESPEAEPPDREDGYADENTEESKPKIEN
jgi:hypothetical protein